MRRPRLRRRTANAPPGGRGRAAAFVGGLGRAARSVGYAAQDLLFLLGRAPRAVWRGIKGFWRGLTVRTRQRLVLAILGAGAATAVLALVVPRLPCQFPGGDLCPPSDDAEAVVPADALAYVHLSLDQESSQYADATEALDAVPELARQVVDRVLAQVPGPDGGPSDFERDIAPWLGGQAAVAIVPSGGGAEQVQFLEEGDPDGAEAFAASLGAGAPAKEDYRGVEVATNSGGLSTASVEGFLVIGTAEGVRRVVDVATGAESSRPLSEQETAGDLRDELPPNRFAEAYLSPDGIRTLVADEAGPLSALEPFVDAAASEGAAASAGADEGSLEFAVRSSLEPERAKTNQGFFAAFPPFDPELPERLSRRTLAYVGLAEPGTTVRELLAQATAEAPALAASITAAAERLRDLGDVELEDQLLPSLGGEAAFALQPGAGDAAPAEAEQTTTAPAPVPDGLPQGPPPTPPGEPAVPVLQFVAKGVNTDRARRTLAQLQGPIAEALNSGASLQAPVFDRRELEGVEMQVLRVSPTVNLTYAIAGDDLAVATQPKGVEQVIAGEGGLSEEASFEDATAGLDGEPSLLAYFDLAGLLDLAEREGLAEDPAYALFASEIRRLLAAGLSVTSEPTHLASDLRVVIDQDTDEDVETSSPPAE